MIATDAVSSSVNVYEAAPEDKARTTIVETAKVGTGIGAGIVMSAIVIGLASGGTGLIVVGIIAFTGAGAVKAFGEIGGAVAGGLYDIVVDE